ncbi:uncharacterized protein LOC133328904 [Musca vetustissima]|uniref:uncharacterized protein LOC133328904 n=1 Tax=Musca vetustissima TaxID=27455 RepID=UPI002AB5E39E|nr:uncharacterized protein LOC133328904 [Musca vetustissima]
MKCSTSPLAANLLLAFYAVLFSLVIQVANASVFGIGARMFGDQLLMKDILRTPFISLTKETVITFNYAIPEPITYIEMISDEEIYVNVDFSYENDLINGTIRRMLPNITQDPTTEFESNKDPFEVLIQIYGYHQLPQNVNSRYILNRGQNLYDLLKSSGEPEATIKETLNLMREDSRALEHMDEEYVEENNDISSDVDDHHVEHHQPPDLSDEALFSSNMNKIVQLGERQEGDYLLYHADQTSPDTTDEPTNHSVIFYFIDNSFITCVEFFIIDHYLNHPLATNSHPIVEYEKLSQHTLKAIVTDQHTTSLFVEMHIYGYEPNDKPVDFKSYLKSGQVVTASDGDDDDDIVDVRIQLPLTAKRRTRVLFNQAEAGAAEASATDDAGQQVGIYNWLIVLMMTTLTVLMIGRHNGYGV